MRKRNYFSYQKRHPPEKRNKVSSYGGIKPLAIFCAWEDGQESIRRTILLLPRIGSGQNVCPQVLKARAETSFNTFDDLGHSPPK